MSSPFVYIPAVSAWNGHSLRTCHNKAVFCAAYSREQENAHINSLEIQSLFYREQRAQHVSIFPAFALTKDAVAQRERRVTRARKKVTFNRLNILKKSLCGHLALGIAFGTSGNGDSAIVPRGNVSALLHFRWCC